MAETFSFNGIFHPNLSSVYSDLLLPICFILRPSSLIYCGFSITNSLLFLPLSIFILYLGLERWQKGRTTSMVAVVSHSDCFVYHLVTMQLIGVIGYVTCCCGAFTLQSKTFLAGLYLTIVPWYGELSFHTLTCMEHFLAVVHPITYVSLRGERGIKIRNIFVGGVWLLTFVRLGLLYDENISGIGDLFLLSFCFIVISLCSISVLWVLIRPGPGEKSADKEKVDHLKQRAFFTIVVILSVVLVRLFWNLTWLSLMVLETNQCISMTSGMWLNLPSNLVLPLLFLRRAGMLFCWRKSNKDICEAGL